MTDISMRALLDAGTHFGHQTRNWSPKMAPFLFGQRQKIHIINLEKTLPLLVEATNYLGQVAASRGVVLFVATKPQAGRLVQRAAEACGCPYVNHRWRGGTLTNFKTMQNSIARMKELAERLEPEAAEGLSKKDLLMLRRQHAKLHRALAGIAELERLPDALFVVDIEHEHIAVKEAIKLGIPVVAVVDSNCDPDPVDYVIPGNDDSSRSIELFLNAAAEAISNAKATLAQQPPPADTADEYVEVEEAEEVVETGRRGEAPKRTTVKTAQKVRAEAAKAALAEAGGKTEDKSKPAKAKAGEDEAAPAKPDTKAEADGAQAADAGAEKPAKPKTAAESIPAAKQPAAKKPTAPAPAKDEADG